jgi:hypothetical protein
MFHLINYIFNLVFFYVHSTVIFIAHLNNNSLLFLKEHMIVL